MKYFYRASGRDHSVELLPGSEGFRAQIGSESFNLRLKENEEGRLLFEVDGSERRVHWARNGRRIWIHYAGRSYALEKLAGASNADVGGRSLEAVLRAPMPGQVRELRVSEGETVEAGQILLLLEAMKMEMRIQAPLAARVLRMAVEMGDIVEKDQILVELDGEDD